MIVVASLRQLVHHTGVTSSLVRRSVRMPPWLGSSQRRGAGRWPLPRKRSPLPVPFPVPAGVTKGRKFRTTWIDYDALAEVHRYLRLTRPLSADGSPWQPPKSWGEPLLVTRADARGGRVNGVRVSGDALRPVERRRLVAPDGGSMLLAVRPDGGPFAAWPTVFARASERIRERFEPRFPHVHPHRLRQTFSIRTLEQLVSGYYAQAARMVKETDADATLKLYLSKADPLMVLRDLLGHSSVLTTESYLNRPGGSQSRFLAEVGKEEEKRNLAIVAEEWENVRAGIKPSGPGARDLLEFFQSVDGKLDDALQTAPNVIINDQQVRSMLAKRAKTLHLGTANYCWFADPAKALCLKLAGTPTADRPLMGMCDSAQATHHSRHRPVWEKTVGQNKVFIGMLGRGQKAERARLEVELIRAEKVLADIDAASGNPTPAAGTED